MVLKAKKRTSLGRALSDANMGIKFNGLALKAKKNKVTERMLIRDLYLSRQKISLVFYIVLEKR